MKVVSVLTGRQAVVLEVQVMENTPDLSPLMFSRIDHKMSPCTSGNTVESEKRYLVSCFWYIKKKMETHWELWELFGSGDAVVSRDSMRLSADSNMARL